MYGLFTMIFCFASITLFGFDFELFQNQVTYEQAEQKIRLFLEKDPSLRDSYKLDTETLTVGDYVLHLAKVPSQLNREPKSLNKTKIAIDPGHFGGEYAILEERYIDVSEQGIEFAEGTLAYQTAEALKMLLEAEGAHVFLSKAGVGKGAVQASFFDWLKEKPDLWQTDLSLSKIFRTQYNQADLIARADAINAFNPDLTICIHYNAHLTAREKEEGARFTKCNFNLAFIPGAFCAGELQTTKAQMEFLRLIVTDDLSESLFLSQAITQQFIHHLNIPLISPAENPNYIGKACLPHANGVFSRNLALTRTIHGPICYGETLLQNNEEEAHRLNQKPCPERIQQVARAYFEGIKNYLLLRVNDLGENRPM